MGGGQFDVHQAHQGTGGGCTDHAGRDDAQRVAGHEGNGAFGDEGQTQHGGRLGGVTLFIAEAVAEDPAGHGDAQRRHHAGCHDGGHRDLDVAGQQRGAEDIGRLVDRAAQVEGHHGPEDGAEQRDVLTLHALQPVGQPFHGGDHGLAQHAQHQHADDAGGQQRQDQHGLEAFQGARQLDGLGQELREVAGQEAGQDAAEEAGADGRGDHAAHHAGCQTRTVGNGERDVAGQDGHHQGEGVLGADLEQVPAQRAFQLGIGRNVQAANGEGQCDEQTACNHEGQHERDTRHQVLVGTAAAAAAGLGLFLGACGRRLAVAPRGGFGPGGIEHLAGVMNGGLGAGAVEPLAHEAGLVDLGVGGDHHQVGSGNFLGGEGVLRADRATGLDLDGVAGGLGTFFQGLGGHEGVGHARGARGDGHDLHAGRGFAPRRSGLGGRGSLGGSATAGQGLAEHAIGVIEDGLRGALEDAQCLGKAGQVDGTIGHDNGHVGLGQFVVRETALLTQMADDLQAERMSGPGGGRLQGLADDEAVGGPGLAGGNRQDACHGDSPLGGSWDDQRGVTLICLTSVSTCCTDGSPNSIC